LGIRDRVPGISKFLQVQTSTKTTKKVRKLSHDPKFFKSSTAQGSKRISRKRKVIKVINMKKTPKDTKENPKKFKFPNVEENEPEETKKVDKIRLDFYQTILAKVKKTK
jgi:hypothetical protein